MITGMIRVLLDLKSYKLHICAFCSQISHLGSKYAIWSNYEKWVRGGLRHVRVVDRPTLVSEFFLGGIIGISGDKYAIRRVCEKLT